MGLAERVYEIVREIPTGKVMTYGQIAERLGDRHLARAVGNALHVNPDPVGTPCFKVVNAQGRVADNFGCGGAEGQIKRLRDDGVEVICGRVDLDKYRW